jgi:hypothetical protein
VENDVDKKEWKRQRDMEGTSLLSCMARERTVKFAARAAQLVWFTTGVSAGLTGLNTQATGSAS